MTQQLQQSGGAGASTFTDPSSAVRKKTVTRTFTANTVRVPECKRGILATLFDDLIAHGLDVPEEAQLDVVRNQRPNVIRPASRSHDNPTEKNAVTTTVARSGCGPVTSAAENNDKRMAVTVEGQRENGSLAAGSTETGEGTVHCTAGSYMFAVPYKPARHFDFDHVPCSRWHQGFVDTAGLK